MQEAGIQVHDGSDTKFSTRVHTGCVRQLQIVSHLFSSQRGSESLSTLHFSCICGLDPCPGAQVGTARLGHHRDGIRHPPAFTAIYTCAKRAGTATQATLFRHHEVSSVKPDPGSLNRPHLGARSSGLRGGQPR